MKVAEPLNSFTASDCPHGGNVGTLHLQETCSQRT
uniref:Uncharacterized protein n=1 Tax=Anguilla anguilla TaxID=7936 RepID=A0A0E9PQ63_ANGAN